MLACFHPFGLPSSHRPPAGRPGRPAPPDADLRTLWKVDAERVNALYGEALNTHRAALGLPPVDNVRDHVLTGRPWLAADPVLAPWRDTTDLDLLQTGAWILPDERPLPAGLAAFLATGEPPVYVGFGSMAMRGAPDVARSPSRRYAPRATGSSSDAAGPTWPSSTARTTASRSARSTSRPCSAGWPPSSTTAARGTTTTAAVAGAPQVVVPQIVDQPHWAARVAELGIGAAHDGPTPTFESLSAALATALAPETRARAAAVAGTVRTDGATTAARLLLDGA